MFYGQHWISINFNSSRNDCLLPFEFALLRMVYYTDIQKSSIRCLLICWDDGTWKRYSSDEWWKSKKVGLIDGIICFQCYTFVFIDTSDIFTAHLVRTWNSWFTLDFEVNLGHSLHLINKLIFSFRKSLFSNVSCA